MSSRPSLTYQRASSRRHTDHAVKLLVGPRGRTSSYGLSALRTDALPADQATEEAGICRQEARRWQHDYR
ncbi:unnamed protein product, partial [Protopolystoma xenopodis]